MITGLLMIMIVMVITGVRAGYSRMGILVQGLSGVVLCLAVVFERVVLR
jgi:hypothetical protein